MTDHSDRDRIKKLERELKTLREENEHLVDRAENIFLLGNISDRINEAKTMEAAIAVVMEDIVTLKDMECCACLLIEKDKVFSGGCFPDSKERKNSVEFLKLTAELDEFISLGKGFIDLTATAKLPSYLAFYKFNRQPSAVNFIPLGSAGGQSMALLTVDSSPGGVELKKIIPLLERIGQSLVTRLENLRLLKDIRTLNQTLEKKVRKRTQSLRESEEKFRAAFSGTSDILVISKLATHEVLQINDAFTRFTGYSERDVKGKTINELGIWVDQQARRTLLDRIKAGKTVENLKAQFKIKSGEIRTGLLSVSLVNIKGEQHLVTSLKDITLLEEYESVLNERQKLYEQLVETSSDSIFIVQDDCIQFCNEMLLKTSGYTREELLGKPIINHIEPSELPKVKQYYKKRLAGETVPQKFLSRAVTKSGEILD
ncbi:MAG: PAS domain S-box protein, partial [FCB group bacterium]|nr:PAS domain S-box protein [FCB group bacterium]